MIRLAALMLLSLQAMAPAAVLEGLPFAPVVTRGPSSFFSPRTLTMAPVTGAPA